MMPHGGLCDAGFWAHDDQHTGTKESAGGMIIRQNKLCGFFAGSFLASSLIAGFARCMVQLSHERHLYRG